MDGQSDQADTNQCDDLILTDYSEKVTEAVWLFQRAAGIGNERLFDLKRTYVLS